MKRVLPLSNMFSQFKFMSQTIKKKNQICVEMNGGRDRWQDVKNTKCIVMVNSFPLKAFPIDLVKLLNTSTRWYVGVYML